MAVHNPGEAPSRRPAAPLRLAIDATPLLGTRTGIGRFAARLIEGLAGEADVAISAYAVTWRGRGTLASLLPPGVRHNWRPMPARMLHRMWRHRAGPAIEWRTGAVDVVHGTNYVVPPARRAQRVVSVHDLTTVHFPEMCTPHTRSFPALVARAIAEGAWVHTDADFVRDAHRGRSPETRFRFAQPCAESRCSQWTGSRCGVIDQALASFPRRDFDYVWLVDPPAFDPRLLAGLEPVWARAGTTLYRMGR